MGAGCCLACSTVVADLPSGSVVVPRSPFAAMPIKFADLDLQTRGNAIVLAISLFGAGLLLGHYMSGPEFAINGDTVLDTGNGTRYTIDGDKLIVISIDGSTLERDLNDEPARDPRGDFSP